MKQILLFILPILFLPNLLLSQCTESASQATLLFSNSNYNQIITAGCTGVLSSFEYYSGSPSSGTSTISVIDGAGCGGTVLTTETITNAPNSTMTVNFSSPASLTSGNQYTIKIASTSPHRLHFTSAGLYPGGSMLWGPSCATSVPTYDMQFIATLGAILPVELIDFTGSVLASSEGKNESVLLSWKTASEINNEGFEIERSSDGTDWERISFIEGNGTTNLTQSYSFIDKKPTLGQNYYRLKQIDFDEKFEYSDIRSVEISSPKIADLQVFPNPNDGQFTLSLFKPAKSDASIRIYGTEGNLIWEKYLKTSEELGHWKEELNLPSGKMYYVVSYVGDEVLSQKIISRGKK